MSPEAAGHLDQFVAPFLPYMSEQELRQSWQSQGRLVNDGQVREKNACEEAHSHQSVREGSSRSSFGECRFGAALESDTSFATRMRVRLAFDEAVLFCLERSVQGPSQAGQKH